MHKQSRKLYLFIIIALALAGSLVVASVQQPVRNPTPKPRQPAGEEPEAITSRTEAAKPVETTRQPGPDEFSNFRYPSLNAKGELAFIGLYAAPGTAQGYGQAIFVRSADGSWRITRDGEKVSALNDEVIDINNVALNENGDLTFVATLAGKAPAPQSGAGVDTSHVVTKSQGLFLRTATGVKVIARLGEEVPNMPSFFSGIANPSSNSKGMTAFIGTYTDPDGRGLFVHEQGKLRLVARSGQKISSADTDVFSEHYYPSQLNERGEIAWFSRVGQGGGIFVLRPKGIEAAAMQSKPAPIEGGNFIGFGQRAPAISNNGDVLFTAFYDGPNAGRGLFLKREGQPVKLVYKSGDRLPGMTATFTDFYNPQINARGDIAFVGYYGGRNRGVFRKTAKGLEAVALLDQKVPGGAPDELFNNFAQLSLNENGDLVFYAQMRNVDKVGIYLYDSKGLRAVAQRGGKMPSLK